VLFITDWLRSKEVIADREFKPINTLLIGYVIWPETIKACQIK